MKVEMWDIEKVKPFDKNPRRSEQAVHEQAGSSAGKGRPGRVAIAAGPDDGFDFLPAYVTDLSPVLLISFDLS